MLGHLGKVPSALWMIPTITPNSPRADPKISTTRILMKLSGFCASATEQPDPVIPTQILRKLYCYPHARLENPTVMPVQNSAYPANTSSGKL